MALIDPKNKETLDFIESLKNDNGWNMHIYVISLSSLKKIWKRYEEAPFMASLEKMQISLTGSDLEKFEQDFGGLLELKKKIRDIPTTQVVTIIMAGAVKMKASDVHFEPQKEQVRLRFRIDGVLQEIGDLPPDIYRFILSRIKMMGKIV